MRIQPVLRSATNRQGHGHILPPLSDAGNSLLADSERVTIENVAGLPCCDLKALLEGLLGQLNQSPQYLVEPRYPQEMGQSDAMAAWLISAHHQLASPTASLLHLTFIGQVSPTDQEAIHFSLDLQLLDSPANLLTPAASQGDFVLGQTAGQLAGANVSFMLTSRWTLDAAQGCKPSQPATSPPTAMANPGTLLFAQMVWGGEPDPTSIAARLLPTGHCNTVQAQPTRWADASYVTMEENNGRNCQVDICA